MTEAGRITAAIDGDVSGLANALNQARSQATAAVSGIESDFKSKLGGGMSSLASDISQSMQGGFGGIRDGLTKSLTSGDFSSAGSGIGNQVVSGLSSSLGPIGGVAGEVATALGPSGIIALGAVAGGAVIAGAIVSGVASAVAAAGQFETAMSGAKKVISLDEGTDAGAYFSELGSDLQELSTQAPVAATDLAALAAVGGSLGVASSEIAGFAESAAQMSVAFELPAEQAATAAAKILNAFQQPINTENMQSLGNVINQIGDSMAATEADVLDFTNRASFLNTTMGLSVTQVATLGGVLISAGLTAETAAGGIKSAMNQLTSTSSKTGGMDNWAALMGVSVDELKGKVASDLPNALIETANKIAAIEDPVERFQTAVNLAGSEGAPALLKLAGAQDTYNSALAQTIEQWDKGQNGEAGGMAKTFEQNSSTYEAAGTMLSNAFTYASVALGNVFLPAATAATSGLTELVVGAVHAGQAIGSIISGSDMASAIGSAFGSIGSIASAAIGNLSAIITPVWNALGGGTAVMAGLQAAFNLVTAPITAFYTGISTLAGGFASLVSAAEPVASIIGEGIAGSIEAVGSAITTGSAYAQAFGEAITDMVSNSSAVQALSGAFDTVKTAITNLVSFASDIGSKIMDGLTAAIPTAASGFSSAIGSLMGQAGDAASGYFTDAVKDSPLGGIFGFVDSVSSRASEIMATGKASAASVAEGIESSPELNESLKKAADFDSPENIEAAKKAGINVGGAAGEESAKGYWDEFEKEFTQQQTERDISKLLARGTTENKGNVSGYVSTSLENGLEIKVAYQGNNKSIMSRLFIDGQQVGGAVYGANREESVRKLLEASELGYNEGNVLDLTGKSGEAELWRLNQSQDVVIDKYLDYAANIEDELAGAGQEIGDAFAEGMVPDLDTIMSKMYDLQMLQFYDPAEAEKQGVDTALAYMEGLARAVDEYDKAKTAYLLEPNSEQAQADFLKARDDLQAMSDSMPVELQVKADVDTGIFGSEMSDIKGSINLADILADPEEFEEKIMDVPDFVENTFQPALSDEIDFMVGQWDSGYTEAREQTEDFVDDLVVASEKMPSLFSTSQLASLEKYKNGLIDAKQALEGLGYEAKEVADAIDRINFAQNADEGSYEDVMFYHSYIGPTSGYASWLAEESGRSEEEVRNVLIKLNTTEAEEELKKLDEKATTEQSKTLKINDTLAMRSIAAIDLAAAKSITKTVFVEYDDPGYSYDDYTSISAASASSSSKKVSTTTGKITKYYPWMSFANEGYVASPTLAVVGDRPGGEYVVGAARFEAAAAKAGGQTITIAPVYHINGTGLSADEVTGLIEKNNKALLKEVASQIKDGKSF